MRARSTRKKVRDAIAAVAFDSLYAHIKYGENGQIVLPQVVIQIQEARWCRSMPPISSTSRNIRFPRGATANSG